MSDQRAENRDPWDRIGAAIERLEQAGAAGIVRRTAAESATPDAPDSGEVSRLNSENESLRSDNADLSARLAEREATIERLRREAARMAGQVDKALEQLALIEKG